ncbi:double-stranded RNA-specific editase B2 [Paramormyrops kingsleyae]|uniref:Adenosine deaminase RNA specific B2 (inactive) n=2 Tax=Paramormyrops kingsleyae TaxID=1676925 RepID=A0A3B3SE72_9TELE|nr:double-stranded RNA-specific editase B2 [Paramormyrops kingsleyae]
MASVLGHGSRAPGAPSSQLKCKFKRRRRRRSKRKEKVSMLSAFIAPFKCMNPGTVNTEDEDNLSTSSAEVKENRNIGNLEDCALLPGDHQSIFRSDASRGGTSGLKRKRPLEEGNNSHLCKLQLFYKRLSWSDAPKNALVQLNELRPGLQYRMVSQTGPVHAPVFSIAVEVNGLTFEGTGPTKKKAKMRAAEMALRSFVQFPNAPQAHQAMGNRGNPAADFTSDQADFPDSLFKEFEPASHADGLLVCGSTENESVPGPLWHGRPLRPTLGLVARAGQNKQKMSSPVEGEKSPVVLLNELRPGLRYVFLSESAQNRHSRSFVMAVRVDGRIFEGSGRSKKLAKRQAALSALQALELAPERRSSHIPSRSKCPHFPQAFADAIFHLVTEKYRELAGGCSPTHARHKALAGIIMTRGLDLRQAQVIAISTGTKCLSGEYISEQGLAVHDCHAEVIARRAFLRFLYAQLELFLSKNRADWEQSIFIRHKEASFRLRENILFHMYISTSPCGDARLNSPYEISTDLHAGRPLVKKPHGKLRAKVETGEGTLPVRCSADTQTWDGVLQGEQLITMSCTDKISRWNVLGLQGSLLTHFVEPIYLHSLTVGSLRHPGHFSRTVARRLEHVDTLPPSYRRNQLLLSGLSRDDSRQPGKSPCFSVNWTVGDGQLEVVNAATGKRKESGAASRLCKRGLFARWARLHRKLSMHTTSHGETPLVYAEAKLAARSYQAAKQQLFRSLREAGLGTWVKKPPELDQFELPV